MGGGLIGGTMSGIKSVQSNATTDQIEDETED
jgi:hypothetical protein